MDLSSDDSEENSEYSDVKSTDAVSATCVAPPATPSDESLSHPTDGMSVFQAAPLFSTPRTAVSHSATRTSSASAAVVAANDRLLTRMILNRGLRRPEQVEGHPLAGQQLDGREDSSEESSIDSEDNDNDISEDSEIDEVCAECYLVLSSNLHLTEPSDG